MKNNTAPVKSLYVVFANRNIDGVMDLLSEDVECGEPENPHNPCGGTIYGHAGFLVWIRLGIEAE